MGRPLDRRCRSECLTNVQGGCDRPSLSGLAKATGTVFGHSKDLAVATANLAAPRSGNLTANLKVTVLGSDQVVVNESEAVSFNKNDTFSKSLPDSFKVSATVPIIGPLSVDVTLGVKGSISMPYFLANTPGESIGYVIPDVQASVYGEAAVGIGNDDIGALVGVKGELNLLNNKLTLLGSASQGTDNQGIFVNYSTTSEDQLTAVSGHVYAFAGINFLGEHELDEDIFNLTGIAAVFTPIEAGEKVYLKPISAVQAKP